MSLANRFVLGIDKEHYYDACTIATQGNRFTVKSNLYKKKCVSDGDFQKTKLNNIGNIIYFGLTDILLVGLVKFRKRLLKNRSKIKDNGNERCVSTHLKVCSFAAVNI